MPLAAGPYDPISVVVLAAAALLLLAAARLRRMEARLACVVLAGLILRVDAAAQWSLHPWDERFHALVAKNLIADPLTPTLYRTPLIDYDYTDWTSNHVWLHKPPAALWLMAGSMRLFGVNEVAMRLPAVLLSSAAVLLTFLIGQRLFDRRVALLAAGFHAVNGFLVALAAGRRVADHVDTALIFFVELGIWAAIEHRHTVRGAMLWLAGAALGAGLLAKSLPALLVVPVAFGVFSARAQPGPALRKSAWLLLVGVAVAAPWAAYIWTTFPRETAWSAGYVLLHATETLEEQRAGALSYLLDMPRFFGELIWLPLAGATVMALRSGQSGLLHCLVWVAIPYAVFTMARTRLPAYVMIAAPALFLVQAHFWMALRDPLRNRVDRRTTMALVPLLAALAVLPARYLLEPTGSFERRDRTPAAFDELRALPARLQLESAVVFNMPLAIEAMFYTPYIAYPGMPTDQQVREISARGVPIVIYEPRDSQVGVPANWNVIRLRER